MSNQGKIGYWRYGETDDSGQERQNIEYVALCNKATFLRTLEEMMGYRGLRGWVLPRMGITSNNKEINAVNQEPDKMVKLDWLTYKIIKRYPLVTK